MRPGRTCEKRQEWPGLRRLRLRHGLTLAQASEGLCSPSTLWSWETGAYRPSKAAIQVLCKRYKASERILRHGRT